MRKLLSRSEGFTLIELMIVILIIAILVAIAVPVFLNARANAQKRTCQANQRTIDSSIQSYESTLTDPAYPASLADMTMPGTKTLKNIPKCPAHDTNQYTYVNSIPPYVVCPNDSGHTI
ncbi:MAG: prepilin-type N-terminal cleavage/methylation domain-containing protein [Actinobacteria bacterium]|nr:prepilin-type N-terminal cleavage/methylation domain-containing protein [Actinomycetota bacterium]